MANRDHGAPIISLLLLLLSLALHQAQGGSSGNKQQSSRRLSASASTSASTEEDYLPVKSVVYRRRPSSSSSSSVLPEAVSSSYEPFEMCQGCRCCSPSNASSCVDTSCCYAIDCDLPGKPFGTCAFTPHTCGCNGSGAAPTGGNNCTQPS